MPAIEVSQETYSILQNKMMSMQIDQDMQHTFDKTKKLVKLTFDNAIQQMQKDIAYVDGEVNGLTHQLLALGVRPYWTHDIENNTSHEEAKTE